MVTSSVRQLFAHKVHPVLREWMQLVAIGRECAAHLGRSQPHSAMSIAALARRLCCSYVDPRALEGLVACRLIPLNKNPRVRAIGVGEMLHRLVAKSVLSVVRGDITQVCGAMELCVGQCAGAEAACTRHF